MFFQLSTKKEKLITLLLAFWIIALAIILTTFLSPILYNQQVNSFHLPELVNMPSTQIKENYTNIIHYLSLLTHTSMQVSSKLITSEATRIHFADVKKVLGVIQIYFLLSTLLLIPLIHTTLKEKRHMFLKTTPIVLIVIIGIVGSFMAINFDGAFTLMHQLIFRNNYWLIDPRIDPIISIFPETFFLELGIILLGLIALMIVLMIVLDKYLKKYYLEKEK
ncbi:TIGR01906 family membrane protein [Sharpea azabuensis]|uniref:TIGR01906 family membrane protein n=1 Tax=Sharpea azabuensis TaxID=322505 RepID=UPI0013DB506B|nr:TIGR01906 family membrane protein [Sharpea azabuensis]